jgi:hypothetical protein
VSVHVCMCVCVYLFLLFFENECLNDEQLTLNILGIKPLWHLHFVSLCTKIGMVQMRLAWLNLTW